MGAQTVHEVEPGAQQLGAVTGELLVPDLERGGRRLGRVQPADAASRAAAPHRAHLLEQVAALLEDPVVVGLDRGEAGRDLEQELVEEAAPALGIGLDQSQVLRGEEHRPHLAEQVAQPGDVLPLEPSAVRLAGGDLEVDLQRPAGAFEARADDRGGLAAVHERGVVGDAMARERREVPQRLDDIGLALPVRTHHDGDAGTDGQAQLPVGAEVGEFERGQVHGGSSPSLRSASA